MGWFTGGGWLALGQRIQLAAQLLPGSFHALEALGQAQHLRILSLHMPLQLS